ncbi:MAG: two-component regulator propeller domain-containing protein, partial [Acidobacteriota bacterium]
QDAQGFMWLGTQDGLNRWDGLEFTLYRHDPDSPSSLPNSYVRALESDAEGNLWVGTSFGLGRFDAVTESFLVFHHAPERPDSLSGEDVRGLYADGDGALWIATRDGGVDRLDIATSTIERLPLPAFPGAIAGADAIAGDEQGRLWFGLRKGLATLRPGSDTLVRFQPDVIDVEVQALYQVPGGPLWAGTTSGLFKVDVDRGEVTPYLMDLAGVGGEGQTTVHALTGTPDGSLWIGTDLGLYRLDPEFGTFEHFTNDQTDPWSLADNEVVALARDRSGLLWVGTQLGGVDRADTAQPFHYFAPQPEKGGLAGSKVVCMAEISPSRVLVGTRTAGVDLWDRTRRTFSPFDADGRLGLPPEAPMAMLRGRGGDLWIGTLGGGLAHLPAGEETFRVLRHDPDDPTSLQADRASALLEGEDGTLWVGSLGRGLSRYDRARNQFVRYPFGFPHGRDGGSEQG